MNYLVRKYICKAILAGLLVGLFPISIYAKTLRKTFIKQKKVYPKLSRKKIDWYLQQIKNTSNVFSNISKTIKKGINKTVNALKKDKFLAGTVGVAGTAGAVGAVGAAIVVSVAATAGVAAAGVKYAEKLIGTDVYKETKDGWVIVKKVSEMSEAAKAAVTLLPLLFIALGVHVVLLPSYLLSLGISSVVLAGILSAVYGSALGFSALYVKRLEKEEKRYPGTLKPADFKIIKIFRNVLKGPIIRALLKGKQIKNARKKIAQNTVKDNASFFSKAKSEKQAVKDIEKYIVVKTRIPGLEKVLYPMILNIKWHNYLKYMDIKVTWKVINEYKEKKKGLNQDERNQLIEEQIQYMKLLYDKMKWYTTSAKRFTAGYAALNAKEIALKLNPAYALNKKVLNSDKKFIKKLNAKYGSGLEGKLKKSVEDYKNKMAKVIDELSVRR